MDEEILTNADKKLIEKGYEKFSIYRSTNSISDNGKRSAIEFRGKIINTNKITFYFDIKTIDINHPVDYEILSILMEKSQEMGWDYEEAMED